LTAAGNKTKFNGGFSKMKTANRHAGGVLLALAISLALAAPAIAEEVVAQEPSPAELAQPDDSLAGSEKLLLTGGVSQLEGAAGGGLTPWAVIGGYGTSDQIGANAFYTRVDVQDYHLDGAGALIGLLDRIELSVAQQRFNTEQVGEALGLGRGFTFRQNIIGLKVKLAGDAVLEQDSWLPQVSVGAQFKKNDRAAVLAAIGAKDDHGVDFYVSATKLYLSQSILANVTLRFTKANQIGILGFGGDRNNSYKPQLEGSVAWLLSRNLAIGAEYRMKPDNLGIAAEDDWFDAFIAWAPSKHVSLTLAYADLGNIVIKDRQRGLYASVQIGF
jgi:opacity protein-like surface antigen